MGQRNRKKQRVEHWFEVLSTAANAEAVARSLAEDPTLIDEINPLNGFSALHFAAANGSCDVTALLLTTKPALIDAVDVDGATPLHLAAKSGHDSVAKILLAAKSTLVLVKSTKGANALHSAAMHGHPELVRLLLVACPSSIDTVDYQGMTPLLYGFESDKLMRLFLAANPKNLNALDHYGQNILHRAVKAGREDYVEQLLAMEPDLIRSLTARGGDTPLHLAMDLDADKHKQLIEKLFELHPQAVRVTNKRSQTPFHVAVKKKKDSLMDLLQWGLSFDEVADSFSRFYKSFSNRLKSLIEVQCTPLLGKDVMGTVLDYLGLGPVAKQPAPEKVKEWFKAAKAAKGDASTISRLLAEEPMLIDTIHQSNYVYTALHFAARHGYEGTVVQLLAAKPALIHAVNLDGATALHLATYEDRARVVEILLAANPSSALAADYRGNTALHYAAKLRASGEVVDLLLAACPASLDLVNLDNKTPLLTAFNDYNLDLVSRLLAANPKNVDAADSSGWNALHHAVAGNNMEYTMRLLEIQPDLISTRTREGDTPLHLAIASTSIELIQKLFELDPQAVKVANLKGLTPLQIAANSQNNFLMRLFAQDLDDFRTRRN